VQAQFGFLKQPS